MPKRKHNFKTLPPELQADVKALADFLSENGNNGGGVNNDDLIIAGFEPSFLAEFGEIARGIANEHKVKEAA